MVDLMVIDVIACSDPSLRAATAIYIAPVTVSVWYTLAQLRGV